jgi:hypothetical protein
MFYPFLILKFEVKLAGSKVPGGLAGFFIPLSILVLEVWSRMKSEGIA